MPKTRKPIDAVVAVTYACNSKCVMCDIWKMEAKKPLDADQYLKLPSSLKYLNISGGEPFLRPDIVDVVKNMRKACPKAQLIFSSNGLVPELVVEKMDGFPYHKSYFNDLYMIYYDKYKGDKKKTEKKLSELASCMDSYPQVLINCEVSEKKDIDGLSGVVAKIGEVENALADDGRVLVRYSGTEKICRVMIEGKNQEEIEKYANDIVEEIKKEIGV